MRTKSFYRARGKPTLDFAASFGLLLVLAPVIAVLWLLVRMKLGAPAFFRQDRPGLGGRVFTMVKFRSMTDARDANGRLLPDAERLPAFGKFLRSTSLDELPELWNVLKGDMSLVGPRPLKIEYLDVYTQEERRRHEVRPGITGWAQVNGRNATSWDERFRMDVEYVDSVSLKTDFKIMLRTIRTVLVRDGVSAHGHATMPSLLKFRENAGHDPRR